MDNQLSTEVKQNLAKGGMKTIDWNIRALQVHDSTFVVGVHTPHHFGSVIFIRTGIKNLFAVTYISISESNSKSPSEIDKLMHSRIVNVKGDKIVEFIEKIGSGESIKIKTFKPIFTLN